MAEINIKLLTAKIVEDLLRNLEADVSSEKDVKLLVDLVYQQELQIDELKNDRIEAKPKPPVQVLHQEQQCGILTTSTVSSLEKEICNLKK